LVTEDHQIVKKLRGVAAKLTGDLELQKDLMQEMFMHLVRVEADQPGQTPSWYLQGCQFHARGYLARGRSVDSIKRQKDLVSLDQGDDNDSTICVSLDSPDPIDLHGEVITRDIVDLLVPQLTDLQQQILSLLMHGFGMREMARELRVSHPTVIKHRKRIARIASALLVDAGCNCSNRASLITLNPTGYDVEENGKVVRNTARQHEDMPNRMVVRQPAPGVEADPCGVGQTSNKQ
jgi:DNA-binding CsgD family transcriptional regulator